MLRPPEDTRTVQKKPKKTGLYLNPEDIVFFVNFVLKYENNFYLCCV